MKRVYYNPDETVRLVMTAGSALAESRMPSGDFIEVDDDVEVDPIKSYRVQAGQLVFQDIEPVRIEAQEAVRRAVREKRLEFITDLPAQTEIYKRKEAEARAYLADPSPDMADYPRLSDEVGVTAATADDLAALWVAMADAWDAADRAVEKARMVAKVAVASATTTADVDAALAALHTALDAVQPPIL